MSQPKSQPYEEEASLLSSAEGHALLAEVASVSKPGVRELEQWRKHASFESAAAAIRLVQTRRKGAVKFSLADAMWFDPVGLEQATAEAVAIHKARRFEGSLAVDLCCGIGGDSLAIAQVCNGLLAVDRDHGMLRRARWNAAVYGAADRVLFVQSTAERMSIPSSSLVHIDPDRRARRTSRAKMLEGYTPGIDFLREMMARVRGGAIKLGPASDFEAHFQLDGCEIELVSLNGECKEATIWFGDRATCRRKATALPSGVSWTDRDGRGYPGLTAIGETIIEPDASLIRSGLLDGFASAHKFSRFAEGIDLLTAANPVPTGMTTVFVVETVLPLDIKAIRREVLRRELGRLEIKTRGVEIRPEELRQKLKLEGCGESTLFLIGGAGRGQAIFANRRPA